jgi:hypothetical protein
MKRSANDDVKVLVEALQDTLKEQVDNYISSIDEIQKSFDAESTDDYSEPLRIKSQNFIKLLGEIKGDLTSLKDKAKGLVSTIPDSSTVYYDSVKIKDFDLFKKLLRNWTFNFNPKKKGKLYMWNRKDLFLYSETNPFETDGGEMGVTYLVGKNEFVEAFKKDLAKVAELSGEDQKISLTVT